MNKKWSVPLFAAIALQFGCWGTAFAGASFMPTGGRTTQPVGHYEFCQSFPQECRQATPKQAPLELTRALWDRIVAVNNSVNTSVAPRTDMEMWGREEVWSFPTNGEGDCEDYVLEKRRDLYQMGLSLANLLITVVRKPDGEGHAVLTVRTTKGDMILDNLRDDVLLWKDTEYRYLKRQASTHTGQWVTIREEAAPLVSSVE